MKKILLYIILCVCPIYGMQISDMSNFPDDIQKQIITALVIDDDIGATIYAIKSISLTSKQLNQIISEHYGTIGSLEGFTTFVAQLAKKFPTMTRDQIAEKLKMEMGIQYIDLGKQLLQAADIDDSQMRFDTITNLINQGADAGYTSISYLWIHSVICGPSIYGPSHIHSALHKALIQACRQEDEQSIEVVNLLLDQGADFNYTNGVLVNLFKVIEGRAREKALSVLKDTKQNS